jgi:cytoplasmic iron level regulating protein YaaA (DUF328/UPF0246 family)
MRIILSPAKKMRVDTDFLPAANLPRFLPQAEELAGVLRAMDYPAQKALWKCSDKIAQLNSQRLETMDLRRNLTPAILAYEGIQYQYMAPGVFTDEELAYVQDHVRILSGLYGLLRPFDGVTPYRLEMGAKLATGQGKDLYEYWGAKIAEELFRETDCVVNLASQEYSRCVSPYVPENARFLTCVFGEEKGGKIIEKGTLCKMARGEMVRFLAQKGREDPEAMQDFRGLGYRFSPAHSNETTYTFIKEDETHAGNRNQST